MLGFTKSTLFKVEKVDKAYSTISLNARKRRVSSAMCDSRLVFSRVNRTVQTGRRIRCKLTLTDFEKVPAEESPRVLLRCR